MKNRSTLKNILILICLLLITILIILLLLLYNSISKKEKVDKKEKNNIIKKYNIEDIENITFDIRNAKVYYLHTNNEKLVIKQYGKTNKYLIQKTKEKNKISYRELPQNVLLKTTYKIYIPKNYINNIKIINGFGNIKIGDFDNDIKIENNSGNLVIGKINNLEISNVSGNINIKKIKNNLKASSSTGDILIDSISGSIDIDSIIGDITINNFLIKGKSDVETTSGIIDIKINKKSDCKLVYNKNNENNKKSISKKVCNKGRNPLNIRNVTGEVIIK